MASLQPDMSKQRVFICLNMQLDIIRHHKDQWNSEAFPFRYFHANQGMHAQLILDRAALDGAGLLKQASSCKLCSKWASVPLEFCILWCQSHLGQSL